MYRVSVSPTPTTYSKTPTLKRNHDHRSITVENLGKRYLLIIGANGAGKSTLLKILSRITDPTEGRAVIGGCN